MDEGSSPRTPRRGGAVITTALAWCILIGLFAGATGLFSVPAQGDTPAAAAAAEPPLSVFHFLPLHVLAGVVILLILSAFFSSSETAFFAIPHHRARSMHNETRLLSRLVAQMLARPGQLLTTILVGNMIVNVLVGVLLGTRVISLFEYRFGLPYLAAYVLSICVCTTVLVFFGEITPKVFAVRAREGYARLLVVPLLVADRALAPLRDGLLALTQYLFRITRFHELRAAPFITDDELKSLFSNGEPSGVIEDEERQMIRRILEFHDVLVREILVPRPDIVALPEETTLADALARFREEGYSRMPVYADDLDHITGVLYVKDLLPGIERGETARTVREMARTPLFVPEVMPIQQFVRRCQGARRHLAVVVDEYGGTEGIVTLQDALEEVVGDIAEHDETEEAPYERLAENAYRVPGSFALDELAELLDVRLKDEEHETVAGFLMSKTDKVLEAGERIEDANLSFTVEEVDGKRASSVRVKVRETPEDGAMKNGGTA